MRTSLPILGPCVLLLCSLASQAQHEQRYIKSKYGTVCYRDTKNANTFVPAPEKYRQMKAGARTKTASIQVAYDGFTPEAEAAFEAAVDIWRSLLTSDVQINVLARWAPLGGSTLGSAGPGGFIMNFEGAQKKNVWYPVALAEKMARKELNGTDPDIVATFNSTFSNWHYGLDGQAPPPNTYDLMSVVLHEIVHGLGVTHTYEVIGDFYNGRPIIYDAGLENSAGQNLMTSFASPSSSLGSALTSQSLFYSTPLVLAANSGERARIYAPSNYSPGSSIAHLDEATYAPGNINSLMTPQFSPAERILDPGPVITGILKDMGWITAFIEHTPLKGTENTTDPFEVVCKVTSDNSFDPGTLTVRYASDGAPFVQVPMTPTGTPSEFSAIIPNGGANYKYFIRVTDGENRTLTNPGQICAQGEAAVQGTYSFEVGPDTKPPVINHVPVQSMTTFDTLRIEAVITDNIGVKGAGIQWNINGVDQADLPLNLKPGTDSTYFQGIIFPEGSLQDGDKINYRVTATDLSVAENVQNVPSPTEFFSVNVNGLLTPRESYTNDFNDLNDEEFFGTGFGITTESGFVNGAIHSVHPYPEGNGFPNDHLTFTYQLRVPIKVHNDEALIKFDEIVLVEPGEEGAPFGSDDFYDYVVVEGSKDGGITWVPIADGYDSRDDGVWFDQWNNSLEGQIATAVGTPAMYRSRVLNLRDKFTQRDVVTIRFRLYSDPFSAGWGWAIDNLAIQADEQAPTIKHQHIDYIVAGATSLNVEMRVSDPSGLDHVITEYKVNDGDLLTHELIISPVQDLYADMLQFPALAASDNLFYRIRAIDQAGNEGVYPPAGFLQVASLSLDSPVDSFVTDFASASNDVFGNFFTISTPAGFSNSAIHSPHPYKAAIGEDPSSSNLSWVVRKPIKVNSYNPFISFDEVVITQYSGVNPTDYVVMEASKDGITWEALVPKHAANFDSDWKDAYDSDADGSKEMFVNRIIDITESGTFEADDVILVRFRMFSNAAITAWGFAIDNLSIQGPITGVSHFDESFSIYPNPIAGDKVYLRISPGRGSQVTIEIVGAQGQSINTEHVVAGNDVIDHALGVGTLPAGLYVVRVKTPKGLSVGKFIKIE